MLPKEKLDQKQKWEQYSTNNQCSTVLNWFRSVFAGK